MIIDRVIESKKIDWKQCSWFQNDCFDKNNIVYCAINVITDKVYVGKTTKTLKERKMVHLKNSGKVKYYFYSAIRKYGKENFKWFVLKICNNENELNLWERYYINYFKSYIAKNGYNLTMGGEGCSPNEITRQKISKANKGKPGVWTPENFLDSARKKISIKLKGNKNNLGNKHTEITKQKIANSLKGRKRPKCVCEKMSKTMLKKGINWNAIEKSKLTKRKNAKEVLHINTGIIYNSTPEASEKLNISVVNIWRVCNKTRKQYKGNYFQYA